MQSAQLLDPFPLWLVFTTTIAIVLVSIECGFRFGRRKSRWEAAAKDTSTSAMAGAMLGLLAFMLAFTFGLASARYETRRQQLRDEANAVQTTYLRAGFLAEPESAEIRALLREYVEVRLGGVQQADPWPAVARSEEIHHRIWGRAVAEGKRNPGSIVIGLFTQSLNELIDLHTNRVQAGLRSRIPPVIIHVLYAVTILAMASVGYLTGISGRHNHLVAWALGLAFSLVMTLIVDLDRPQEGLLTVSQQVLVDLQKKLAEPAP